MAKWASVRISVDQQVRDKWDRICDGRKISHVLAFTAIVDWLAQLTPDAQLMIFGQLPVTPELLEMALKAATKQTGIEIVTESEEAAAQSAHALSLPPGRSDVHRGRSAKPRESR